MAVPTGVFSNERLIIIAFTLAVALILALLTYMSGKSAYLSNGIKITSKEYMQNFMLAILADNDNN